MIKQVKLKVGATHAVPTGAPTFRRRHSASPRDTTRPNHGAMSLSGTVEGQTGTGVHVNPPKPRPHILQGWSGEI